MRKYSIVTCARWETQYVLEWATYHAAIGFDHIYFYSNDDDAETLYEALRPLMIANPSLISYRHFPFQGQQAYIYMDFFDRFSSETEWVAFIDIDEFLNLRGKTISEYMESVSCEADSICFNWIIFGNNGYERRPTGSVLRNYTKRESKCHSYTKSMVRTKKIDAARLRSLNIFAFWHSWTLGFAGDSGIRGVDAFQIHEVNTLGDPMEGYFSKFPDSAEDYLVQKGSQIMSGPVIHHYSIKSEEDFIRREQRGLGGAFFGQDHWAKIYRSGAYLDHLASINAQVDCSLSDFWSAINRPPASVQIIPPPPGQNLARGKAATQSSIGKFSIGDTLELDAERAINGDLTGNFAFHSGLEQSPWWQLDLGCSQRISQIRVYNRTGSWGVSERAKTLEILCSQDLENWTTIYRNPPDNIFGGIDGRPLIVTFVAFDTRFVRLQLTEYTYLHLHEVEVY